MRYTNLASAVISLVAYAAPGDAFWRMSCPGRLMSARMDPIVSPGGISGHVHTIAGGSAFNYTMDYAATQTSSCSSCPIKQDLSNYWVPTLYYRTKDGQFQDVPQSGDGTGVYGGMVVYYLQRGGPNNDPLKAFPKDFRMLAGNPFKRNYTDDFAGRAVSFVCLDYNNGSGYYNKLPDKPCPDGLRAQIFFPSCWDGVNLDSADHKSHMAYPTKYSYDNGPCPATHPVHMISIFYEIIFSTAGFDWWTPDGAWQPFVFSMGDPTGYGFHGDFLNGWDVPTLQNATDTCLNDSGRVEDCPVFDFFDHDTSQGCLIAPTIAQPVTGTLSAMPGCNPVQNTNATAVPKAQCNDTASIGTPAVYSTNVTGWDYLGCGTDVTSNRTFQGASWWDGSVTIQSCMNYCGSKGFNYTGLEFGSQCFCGNALADDRAPVSGVLGNCFTPCAGNSSQFCGGASRLSIYKLNTATFVPIVTAAPKQITCPASNGTTYVSANGTFTVECGFDRGGGDIGMKSAKNITDCFDICAGTIGCTFVSLSGSACYMKGGALRKGSANSGVNGGFISIPSNKTVSGSTSSSSASSASSVSGTTSASASSAGISTAIAAASATTTAAPDCPTSNNTYYQSTNGAVFLVECGIDHQAGDMGMVGVKNLQGCLDACANMTGCVDVSLSGTACYMKKTLGAAQVNGGLKGGKFVGWANTTSSTSTTTIAVSSTTSAIPTTSTVSTSTTTKASSNAATPTTMATSTTTTPVATTQASTTTAVTSPAISTSPSAPSSSASSPTPAAASSSPSVVVGVAAATSSPTSIASSSSSTTLMSSATTISSSSTSTAVSSSPTTTAAQTTTVSTTTSAQPTTTTTTSAATSTTTVTTTTTTAAAVMSSSSSAFMSSSTTFVTSVDSTSSTTSAATPTVTAAVCPQNNGTIYVDPSTGSRFLLECLTDHSGGDLAMLYVRDLAGCIAACASTQGCVDVSLSGSACYMKKSVGKSNVKSNINGALLITTTSSSANAGATAT